MLTDTMGETLTATDGRFAKIWCTASGLDVTASTGTRRVHGTQGAAASSKCAGFSFGARFSGKFYEILRAPATTHPHARTDEHTRVSLAARQQRLIRVVRPQPARVAEKRTGKSDCIQQVELQPATGRRCWTQATEALARDGARFDTCQPAALKRNGAARLQ